MPGRPTGLTIPGSLTLGAVWRSAYELYAHAHAAIARKAGLPESVVRILVSGGVSDGLSPGDYGKVAYFISEGGTAPPSPGGPLPARLQRLEF